MGIDLSLGDRSSRCVFSVSACTGHGKIASTVNSENVEAYVRSWIVPWRTIYFSRSEWQQDTDWKVEAAERLKDELVAEMTRAQIIRTGINLRFGNVVLEKRAPISGLTEDVFIRQIDELDPVMLVFRNDVLMALRRNKLIPQELANFYGPFGRSCFHKLSKVHT